jgi:hypothetical protein
MDYESYSRPLLHRECVTNEFDVYSRLFIMCIPRSVKLNVYIIAARPGGTRTSITAVHSTAIVIISIARRGRAE